MLAIRVSPDRSYLHFVCKLFEYKGLSKEREKKTNVNISDGQIHETNKQIHSDFFSVIKSVCHSISQRDNQSLLASQSVSRLVTYSVTHSLD